MTSILITLGGALAAIAFWCLTLSIISLMGWRKLASRFRAHSSAEQRDLVILPMEGMTIGRFTSYNHCLDISVRAEGLYIQSWKIFAFAHPSLLVPWSELRFLREANSLFGKKFLYDLGTPRLQRVTFSGKVHQAIAKQQR